MKTVLICASLFCVSVVVLAQEFDLSIRDQVMLNTARIDSLISGLQDIQKGGTQTAQLAIQVTAQGVQIMEQQKQIDALTRQFYNVLTYVFLQTAAVATFGIRYWIASKDRQS